MSVKDVIRVSAIISGVSGAVILFGAIYPIASYESDSRQRYPRLISPLAGEATYPYVSRVDYTKASNWFVGDNRAQTGASYESRVTHYNISIPSLGIKDAEVAIGGEDLSENLIHFAGTNMPGKIGNSVIFGHSILPQYFNPKDYLSIFSTLPTIDVGAEIFVDYDGISYKYRVQDVFEVLPTELHVLDQQVNGSYLSLVTCVPPGHPLKPRRLVVKAVIIPPGV